ncbi:MAG: ribosome rescue protein RqcH [Thermoplasmata archaeon]
MKEGLTSFDIRVLVGELSQLRGAYLDKVYQADSAFILKFNLPRVGKREVFIQPGKWIFLGGEFEKPREPPPFAQSLRKVLDNALLHGVEQRGFDRILLMEFEKEARYTLVIEMFGRGNLILVRDEEILHALRWGKWRTRKVKRGEAYKFPPEGTNPTTLDFAGFRDVVGNHKGPVVKVLASGLNLGGLYAEEICLRSKVSKNDPVESLEDEQVRALYKELQRLFTQLEEPAPTMIFDEVPVDVIPFPLRRYEDYKSRRFESLSEALNEYVMTSEEEPPRNEVLERIERRIRKQEEVLRDLREEVGRVGVAADYLYVHYQEVDKLLRLAREGDLREGVNLEKGVVPLEVNGQEVEIQYDLGVDENARLLYEKKKALVDRIGRVQQALEESRGELRKAQSRGRREVAKPSYKPSKKFWFDAYRWSLSSGGFLILGGRDARSNEKLVRKHLEPGDRYVHADLPGAPSVLLKKGSEAEERDLKEACRFAVVFSKAWKLGLGSGSAYWVTPEQVSKTAESGEYLRTGSFVIRGKRNYVHNLALALGVGEIDCQGTRRVIAADPDAMEGLSSKYLILKPAGSVDRRTLVRRLSEAFRVPPDEVERLLPSGTFHLGKVKGLRLEEGNG